MKIVLVVSGLLLLCGLLGATGLYYAGRMIEQKASKVLDLGSALEKVAEKAGTEAASGQSAEVDETKRPSSDPPADDAAAAGVKDACAILTREEIQNVTGLEVGEGKAESEGSTQNKCKYAAGSGGIYGVELEITWEHGKAAMALLQSAGPKMVPGSKNGASLGDASYFAPMDVGVWVLKGDRLFSLNFGLAQVSREKKIALAEKVVSKLE